MAVTILYCPLIGHRIPEVTPLEILIPVMFCPRTEAPTSTTEAREGNREAREVRWVEISELGVYLGELSIDTLLDNIYFS